MDFTKYELSDELRDTLEKDYQTDVQGLKNKNSELIERESKLKADNETMRIDFETKEHDAAVALAEANGSVEEYKKAVAAKEDAMTVLRNEFQQETNARLKTDALNDFSAGLTQDPAGRMYMQSKFTDAIDIVDGNVVSKDGKSLDELKNSLVTDKANASYIAANVGSGAGSAGSNGGTSGGTPKNDVKSRLAERLAAQNL